MDIKLGHNKELIDFGDLEGHSIRKTKNSWWGDISLLYKHCSYYIFSDLSFYLLPYKRILSSLVIKKLRNNVLKPTVTSIDIFLCPAATQLASKTM